MADPQCVLQGSYVALAVPQFLDDADAVWVRKDREKGSKFFRDEKSVRHSSSPFCCQIQTFEYVVPAQEKVVKCF
jgi:hypothetical protein